MNCQTVLFVYKSIVGRLDRKPPKSMFNEGNFSAGASPRPTLNGKFYIVDYWITNIIGHRRSLSEIPNYALRIPNCMRNAEDSVPYRKYIFTAKFVGVGVLDNPQTNSALRIINNRIKERIMR